MEQLIAWLTRFFGSWKPWIVVSPWDVAVVVRLGKRAFALGPGPHLRIPFVDQVTLVNTRLRVATTPTVTLSNGNPHLATVKRATIGYVIEDPLLAMIHYNNPEVAVIGLMQARLVAGDHEPGLQEALAELRRNGIGIVWTQLIENVEVRTYRILQATGDVWGGVNAPPSPNTSLF